MSAAWRYRIGVMLLAAAAYGAALRTPFLFDDHETIVNNPSVHRWSWADLRDDFFPSQQDPSSIAYYRPFQTLSHRLDVTLWGLNPAGHHLTNLLFHILCAWLVMHLGWFLGLSPAAGFAAGALFGVHPIIVSELLMVAGRPEIMSFFFSLLAVLLLARDRPAAILGGAAAHGAGLLSKESALAAPFFVALVWGHTRRPRRAVLALGLLILVTLIYAGLRAQADAPLLSSGGGSAPVSFLWERFPLVLVESFRLAIWPWPLYLYRQMPPPEAWRGVLVLIALAAIAWRVCSQRSIGRLGFLWYGAAWIPKILVMMQGQFLFDHWIYPALPGLLWPLAVKLKAKTAVAGLLVVLSLITGAHIALRNTDEKNYRWALRHTRATPVYFNLGLICLRSGRAEEALSYFTAVHALYPEDENIQKAVEAARRAVTAKAKRRRS